MIAPEVVRVFFNLLRRPLIKTPLQRGDFWGAGLLNCFNSFATSTRGDKTVETVAIHAGATNTQLKLGVNEKAQSNLLLQCTSLRHPLGFRKPFVVYRFE